MAKPTTTTQVIALKPFALGPSEFLPGVVNVPSTSVEKLVAKGFIEAPEPSEGEKPTALEVENDVLRELLTLLSPEDKEGDGVVQTLKGIIEERNHLRRQVYGTPASVEELSKATNSAVAQALLAAGFNTLEKLRAATDEQLKAVENVGDATIIKLRELAK